MGARKDQLLAHLNEKCKRPICWVHPKNIGFVRVNFPDLPIGCARGNMMWWVLQGDSSFRVKNDSYSSYKVTEHKNGEDHFRKEISQGHQTYFMPDDIEVSEEMCDLKSLYENDSMSKWFKSISSFTKEVWLAYKDEYRMVEMYEYTLGNPYAKPKPSILRPCFFQPSSLTYQGVSLEYPKHFNLDTEFKARGVELSSPTWSESDLAWNRV